MGLSKGWQDGKIERPDVMVPAVRYDSIMLKVLIRSVFAVLATGALAILWLATGPWWAEALDAIHTTRLATATSVSIREFSGFFHFFPGREGARLPEAEGFSSDDWGNPLELVGIRLEPGGTLVLIDGGRRFVLGKCPGAVVDHGYTPPIPPEPGDAVTIVLDRGWASWPTPWHATCCGSLGGGGSWYPWARYLYWYLTWIKRDGARLDMRARFRQNWESGTGWNDPGAATLVRLDLRPAGQ